MFRGGALALCVLAAGWMGYLAISGGRDFEIYGLTVSAHEPRRPLLILAVALIAWILSTPAVGTPSRLWLRIRLDDRLIVAAIALGVLFVGVRYGTATAGGADSYSYIGQAQSWLKGPLKIPLPWKEPVPWPFAAWTYAPFGYVPSYDDTAIVPVVPPGLPVLMAGASLVGGYCAMFWVVPISGAVLVVSTFLLGRRLGDSRAALAAAALVAASPVFLFHLPQPMSDVPAAAAWTTAFLLLFSPPSLTARFARSFGAGLATAVALLIRPNLAPLAILLPAWLAYKAMRAPDASARRGRIAQIAMFLVGMAPAVIVLALFNWQVHGAPGRFGYRDVGGMFALAHVVPNLKNYGSWFVSMETAWPLAGLVLLAIPAVARWARVSDPSFTLVLGGFAVGLVAEYLLYTPFDHWYYLRFLLPIFPMLAIGLTLLGRRLLRHLWFGPLVAALAVGGLLVRGVSLGAKEHVFEVWILESRYVSIAHAVADLTRTEDLVITGQLTGAVRHYAGRFTFNYNGLEPAWLDRTVAWFEERGVTPYVLLDEWEVDDFRKRFVGEKTLARLDLPPALAFEGASTTRLFEFRDAARTQPTVRVRETPPPRAQCVHPAEPPPVVPGSK